MKKRLAIISDIMLVILIIILMFISVIKLSGQTPTIFGYQLYTIITGSMEPEIEVGDVILSKVMNTNTELKVGDIITYEGDTGDYEGKIITHEIIEIDENTGLITPKGIANTMADAVIEKEQVISVMVCKVEVLTIIYSMLSNNIIFFMIIIMPLVTLLIYEIIELVHIVISDRQERNYEEKQDGGQEKEERDK